MMRPTLVFGKTLIGLMLLSALLVACPRQSVAAAVRATYQGAPGLVPPCEAITLNLDLNDSTLAGKKVSYFFQVSPQLENAEIFLANTSVPKATWLISASPKENRQLTFTGTVTDTATNQSESIAGPVVTLAAGSGGPCGSIRGSVRDGIRFSSLSVDRSSANNSGPLSHIPDDAMFAPNEAIVKLKTAALRTTTTSTSTPESSSASGLQFARPIIGQTGVIRRPSTGLSPLSTGLNFVTAASVTGRATLDWIRSLDARPDVEYAEPNYQVTLESVPPNDPLYAGVPDPLNPSAPVSSQQWHYEQLNLPAAWTALTSPTVPNVTAANAVTVAVIDSGILWHPTDPAARHSDFDCSVATNANTNLPKIVDGYDFATLDDNPFDNDDASFHGTHVAGTIGACSNNGKLGAGVAWNARILPVRAFSKVRGSITSSFEKIAQSVYWAAGIPLPSTLSTGTDVPANKNPAQIINMSLGGPAIASSRFLQDAVTAATNKGVIVIVAAGNKNLDTSEFVPANLRGVIVVGATGPDKSRASYSNHGAAISVMASGGDQAKRNLAQDGVLSLGGCDGYDNFAGSIPPCLGSNSKFGSHFLQGTSMAAPHVTGVIAMMLQAQPKLRDPTDKAHNWARVLAYLRDSSSLSGMALCERGCGAGLLDAARAVQKAIDYPAFGPLLVPTPSSTSSESVNGAVVFGTEDSLIKFSVKNVGDAPAIMNIAATSPGLTAGALSSTIQADGEGLILVNLNRTGVQDGSYAGRISISYGTATGPTRLLEVRAYYSVGAARPISNSQNVRVRLYRRDLSCANDQRRVNFPSFEVTTDGGFNFGNLEFGTYDLIAYRIKPGTTPGPTDEVGVSELGRLDNLNFSSSGTPKLLDQDITLEPTSIIIGPENPTDQKCAPSTTR
jgi:subtilisin family serine protease